MNRDKSKLGVLPPASSKYTLNDREISEIGHFDEETGELIDPPSRYQVPVEDPSEDIQS